MTQKTKSQRTKLEMSIDKQNQYIQHIENTIDEIILANQELEKFQNFQNKVNAFRKDRQIHSKFKKMLRIIPAIKHRLIASTDQKVSRVVTETNKRLQKIDAIIAEMGKKSSTLQSIIKDDIATTADTIRNTLVPSFASEIVNNTKNKLNQLNLSPEAWEKAIIQVYTPNELQKLQNQGLLANRIKARINTLLRDNANIPELYSLQKELNKFHKSFGEHIKDSWSKIKSVFKNSDTQKMQKNTLRNHKVISSIDKNLEALLAKIKKSTELRRAKLESQLGVLSKDYRHIQNSYQGYMDLPELDQEFKDLDQKFTTSLTSESMHLGEQSKPISRSADLSLIDEPIHDEVKDRPLILYSPANQEEIKKIRTTIEAHRANPSPHVQTTGKSILYKILSKTRPKKGKKPHLEI